jgi:hypothetical protein
VEDSTGTDRPESWAFTVHVPRPFASKHVARYKQLAPPAVPVHMAPTDQHQLIPPRMPRGGGL